MLIERRVQLGSSSSDSHTPKKYRLQSHTPEKLKETSSEIHYHRSMNSRSDLEKNKSEAHEKGKITKRTINLFNRKRILL